jgi:AcrR family transcriptional regulator
MLGKENRTGWFDMPYSGEMPRKQTGGRRPAAGRPKRSEVAAREAALIEAAAKAFLDLGYEATSVGEIARRAHASKQTLYRRFPSKAALFSAVMRHQSEAGFSVLSEIVQSTAPAADVLLIYARILILPLVDEDKLRFLRATIASAVSFPEVAEAFWEVGPTRVHAILSQFLHGRMASGELLQGDPDAAAQLFVAICTGRFWSQGLFGIRPRASRAEVEQYARTAVDVFMRVSRLPPPAPKR